MPIFVAELLSLKMNVSLFKQVCCRTFLSRSTGPISPAAGTREVKTRMVEMDWAYISPQEF